MNPSPPRFLLLALLALLFGTGLFGSAPVARAQAPEASRPYLELPFPGEVSHRVTCAYGCYQHGGSMHYAVDFYIPEGAPIAAAAPGTIMAVTWEMGLPVSLNLGDALILYIDHGDGWFTRYVHLSGITVTVGDVVEMGQIIGYGGKTGASADHLHFELKYGNSLHSPSVPINELFGGADPEDGRSYRSNNRPLWELRPTVTAATPTAAPTEPAVPAPTVASLPTATATPEPAPTLGTSVMTLEEESPLVVNSSTTVDQSFQSRLPQLDVGLSLSTASIEAGEPVTATFTLLNASSDQLRLTMLGVGGHQAGDSALLEETIFFDRSIILNPGRSYTFSRQHRFQQSGDLELFAFALGPENEWVPLAGEAQTVRLSVEPAPTSIFLPLLFGPAAAPPEAATGGAMDEAAAPEVDPFAHVPDSLK